MKSTVNVIVAAFLLSLVSAGCYTQMATRDSSRDEDQDEDQYVASDSTGTTQDNPFFVYDDYRYMRYNMTFDYYHPGRWAYSAGIYDPWFDDPWYWPMGWRPYVLYPYPTWYPYGSYYGNHHYWGYYDNPGYYGGGAYVGRNLPNRTRLIGTSRDDQPRNGRIRSPQVTPSTGAPMGSTAPGIRTRGSSGEDQRQPSTSQQVERPRNTGIRTRDAEVPWWERVKQEDKKAAQNQTVTTQTPGQQPSATQGRQRRVQQQTPGSTSHPNSAPGTADRPRRERRDGGQVRQPHSAPPSQQSQPRSSPPANNGGGRERSGGSSSGGASSGGSSSGGSSSGGGSRTRTR